MNKNQTISVKNPRHKNAEPLLIGQGQPTRINANIGTSKAFPDLYQELKKLEVCIKYKADAVMDLSTGGDLDQIRRAIIENSPLALGTVPIYQAVIEAGSPENLTPEILFDVIERQAADGVDFMTVHCGVTREIVKKLKKLKRLLGIVSRGGTFLARWISKYQKENPLFEEYDRLLKIAKQYNVTLSLGDGLRPGCLADANDTAQNAELKVLGKLTKRAWKAGVKIIIEGPGHMPLNTIEDNIKLEKKVCHGAPYYVLGPLVTDVAPGYDHITGAIGGTIAAAAGADFLCYVTPSEHLGLPDLEDIRRGIIASRIAAHAADIIKGGNGARKWDQEMSRARNNLDWNRQIALAIDPERAKEIRTRRNPDLTQDVCTMCGEYCAIKLGQEFRLRRT